MHHNPSHSDPVLRRAVRKRAFTQRTWEALFKRFKELERSGFSQADLARSLSKKPSQVSRVLAGPSNMTLETFAEFADAMGVFPTVELHGPHKGNATSTARVVDPLTDLLATKVDQRDLVTSGIVRLRSAQDA